jgi:hypothetical protein
MYKVVNELEKKSFVTSKGLALEMVAKSNMTAVTDTFSGQVEFYLNGKLVKKVGG